MNIDNIDIKALKRTAKEFERMNDETLELECGLLEAEILARGTNGNNRQKN